MLDTRISSEDREILKVKDENGSIIMSLFWLETEETHILCHLSASDSRTTHEKDIPK